MSPSFGVLLSFSSCFVRICSLLNVCVSWPLIFVACCSVDWVMSPLHISGMQTTSQPMVGKQTLIRMNCLVNLCELFVYGNLLY